MLNSAWNGFWIAQQQGIQWWQLQWLVGAVDSYGSMWMHTFCFPCLEFLLAPCNNSKHSTKCNKMKQDMANSVKCCSDIDWASRDLNELKNVGLTDSGKAEWHFSHSCCPVRLAVQDQQCQYCSFSFLKNRCVQNKELKNRVKYFAAKIDNRCILNYYFLHQIWALTLVEVHFLYWKLGGKQIH